jgi:predicted dienelactone hydrolase
MLVRPIVGRPRGSLGFRAVLRAGLGAIALLAACSPTGTQDAGTDGGPPRDGAPAEDGGADAGTELDAGTQDAGSTDASRFTFPDAISPVGDPASWDVRARGPFRVGYRVLSHTYTPRGGGGPRTIPVHVWYPTWALSGPSATYARIVFDPDSFREAPPAPPAHTGGYPVHVFSHGDRGFAGTTAFVNRYLASHGWVTIAPDHMGNTLGEPVRDPRPYALYHLRSQDVSAALDAVTALPPSDPLKSAGPIATTRAVLSGHSFGTHTVWASIGATFDVEGLRPRCTAAIGCTEADLGVFAMGVSDPRFIAAIPMAGSINRSLFGPMGHASVRVPILAMSGTADPVGADAQYASTDPLPMTWIDIRGACHQFFAIGACAEIPDVEQDRIVSAWALAFSRRHLLADESPAIRALLDGSAPVSDRVTVRRR